MRGEIPLYQPYKGPGFSTRLQTARVFLDASMTHGDFGAPSKSTTFCFWTRHTSDGHAHLTFLRQLEENDKKVILLYHSIWAKDNTLVNCVTSNDPVVTESYVSECWGQSSSAFSEFPHKDFNISVVFEPGSPCAAASTAGSKAYTSESTRQNLTESSRLKPRRAKRSWMIPGTLWCGSGSKAAGFTDLGVFEQTDVCCREHDHCKHTIASFGYRHGVFNSNIFTMSHCDCDNRFRRCLQSANDSMASIVGYGYFNLLKMNCFEFALRMQCTERTWWGTCALSQMTPYAVVKGPTDFNSTDSTSEDEGLGITANPSATAGDHSEPSASAASTNTPAGEVTPPTTAHAPWPDCRPTGKRHCGQSGQSQRYELSPKKENSPDTPEDRETTEELSTTSTPETSDAAAILYLKPTPHKEAMSTPGNYLAKPEQDTRQSGKLETCDGYKDLDECGFQIPALQERFGLHNTELKTLYHCNCTTRLAQQFSKLQEPDDVHSLMLDFVSQSCFTLPHSEECIESKSCPVLTKASLVQRWAKDMAGGRHLEEHTRKIKRLNKRRLKRKDRSVTFLYKRCRRMHSKLQKTKRL